jgi:HPt (histidine-containing phosphotransfer) domain-containing protein
MLVNKNVALEELGISEEDYTEFLGDLKGYAKDTLPQLRDLISSNGSKEEILFLAHSLKGACLNMRFILAGTLAGDLEKYAGGKLEADPQALLAQLEKALEDSFAQFGLSIQ